MPPARRSSVPTPTFAVVWREPDGRAYSGRLEISDRQAHLIGSDAEGARVRRAVWLDDVASIRTSRRQQERVNDQPVVVLERREAGPLRVAPLDGVGRVFELADLLAELAARIPTRDGRVAVVVAIAHANVPGCRHWYGGVPRFARRISPDSSATRSSLEVARSCSSSRAATFSQRSSDCSANRDSGSR